MNQQNSFLNQLHEPVMYPSRNLNETYTFALFIMSFEALCAIKNWNTESGKINKLTHFVRDRALRAFNCVLICFQKRNNFRKF